MWRVSSENGDRWVEYHNGWTADPVTHQRMAENLGRPVQVAPMSDVYQPSSDTDEVGLFLLARTVVDDPVQVTGTTPPLPSVSVGGYPSDAVF
jgi:hypothetical protein